MQFFLALIIYLFIYKSMQYLKDLLNYPLLKSKQKNIFFSKPLGLAEIDVMISDASNITDALLPLLNPFHLLEILIVF